MSSIPMDILEDQYNHKKTNNNYKRVFNGKKIFYLIHNIFCSHPE